MPLSQEFLGMANSCCVNKKARKRIGESWMGRLDSDRPSKSSLLGRVRCSRHQGQKQLRFVCV